MTSIAVVAHSGKTFDGGLGRLRALLHEAGFAEPLWYEVAKSKQAPDCARAALAEGADVIFVWGGDGTVQRCIDALAGSGSTIAILPAGTANLLATNLGIRTDLEAAVQIGLHGDRRALDTIEVNGEHGAVMAGAGLDALMIDDADAGLKDRFGRAAYLWTGAKNLSSSPVTGTLEVEGRRFFSGTLTCILFGNVSNVFAGIEVFDGARPDDGLFEVGVVTAQSRLQWLRTIGRVLVGRAERSPFVATARGTRMTVSFDRKTKYEIDGGARGTTKKLKVRLHQASIAVCVPTGSTDAAASSATGTNR